VDRSTYIQLITQHFEVHPICGILGPRQCGKTTLSKHYISMQSYVAHVFDLEDPRDLARLDHPMTALENLEGLIVIDEVQRRPDLFPILRVLADTKRERQHYLVLGSASPELLRQSSESLAGRIGYIELPPFSLLETLDQDKLWVRGGFPNSFLSKSENSSILWRNAYIKTFLEMDIPGLGFSIPPQQLYRFWMMLTHYHGQLFNFSELGKSLGISNHTARRYVDILEGTFMIRSLLPWFENTGKRLVKTPKIYFRDSGLLNALMGINSKEAMERHPKLGALWEGFALEEILKHKTIEAKHSFFWRTQAGAELDLLTQKNGLKIGFEFKYADAPKITPSLKIAMEDLNLEKIFVIYPGQKSYALTEKISVVSLKDCLDQLSTL
jgi:predicted AAA+ superfamily ATPase